MVVADLDGIAQIYRDGEGFESGNGGYAPIVEDIMGKDAVVMLDGKKHTKIRSYLQTAFVPSVLPVYYGFVKDASREFWEGVSRVVKEKGKCRMEDMIKKHLLRVIVKLTGGADAEGVEDELQSLFLEMAQGFLSFPQSPTRRRAYRARDRLVEKLRAILLKRRQEVADIDMWSQGTEKTLKEMMRRGKTDLITMLCVQKGDDELLEKMSLSLVPIWYGGYATQTSAMLCAVAKMTDDTRLRLLEEQAAVSEGYGEGMTSKDVRNGCMPVLEAYLSEIMRLYPPVPYVCRMAVEDREVLGHKIPAKTPLLLDLRSALRSEKHFKDAGVFNLDRFLGKKVDGKRLEDWVFGVPGGVHFCLGYGLAKMQLTCLMSEMLRNWDVELEPNQNLTVKMLPEAMPVSGCIIRKCERRGEKARTDR